MYNKSQKIIRQSLLLYVGVFSIILFTNFNSALKSKDDSIKAVVQKKKVINGVILDSSINTIEGAVISETKTGKKVNTDKDGKISNRSQWRQLDLGYKERI